MGLQWRHENVEDAGRRECSPAYGFTLIELLVSISIVALIVVILLPTLSQARGRAMLIHSLSNLRQMGLGIQFYAEDYDGHLIRYYQNPSPAYSRNLWDKNLSVYMNDGTRVFDAPADKRPRAFFLDQPNRSYGINSSILQNRDDPMDWGNPNRARLRDDIVSPSSSMVIVEHFTGTNAYNRHNHSHVSHSDWVGSPQRWLGHADHRGDDIAFLMFDGRALTWKYHQVPNAVWLWR